MIRYDLKGVIQNYHGRDVLNIDRLQVESGKIYSLLGANGAGKTTLFNILSFLEPPYAGSVYFNGKLVEYSGNKLFLYRRKVVMVDQHPIMFSTTVSKNVEFGLKIRGVGKVERQRIVQEALERVDLYSYRTAYAGDLSGGETQRLAFARALALSPDVLLCDEPTANVDVENQSVIMALLNRVNQDHGCTVLFTTHDRLQAAGLADETFVLEKGRLVSTSYENIYSCSLHSDNGYHVCLLQEKVRFFLPENCLVPEGCSRIYLNPLEGYISPCAAGVQDSTEEGALRGEIVHIMAEGENVRVTVNTGVMIATLVPTEYYREKRFAVGDVVKVRFSEKGISWV